MKKEKKNKNRTKTVQKNLNKKKKKNPTGSFKKLPKTGWEKLLEASQNQE